MSSGDQDNIAKPIPGTLHAVPYGELPLAQVMMSLYNLDGTKFFADPRNVLQAVVDRLAADGFYPTVALELEFYLADQNEQTAAPLPPAPLGGGIASDGVQVYGLQQIEDFEKVLHDAVAELNRQAFRPIQSLPKPAPASSRSIWVMSMIRCRRQTTRCSLSALSKVLPGIMV